MSERGAGMAVKPCEQCDGPAVWAWQPPGVDDPVFLCDEDASGADLNHLTGLDGLAEVDRG